MPFERPLHASEGSIPAVLDRRRHDSGTALLAPSRAPLTYARLHEVVEAAARTLHQCGMGRGSRVGIALPNGPEMAVVTAAVASVATAAPLNPDYVQSEFTFYLSDVGATALVLLAGATSPARQAAAELGITVIEVHGVGTEAGAVVLRPVEAAEEARAVVLRRVEAAEEAAPSRADPEDVAFVLHTSGTTSRPKMVPLRHSDVTTTAANIATRLELTAADRCLNVMPLFHVHGLINALLATLTVGGSVVCAPGFDPTAFLGWLADEGVTWYTAVPTIHQAVLLRATNSREAARRTQLRLIRSSSSPLPPQLMAGLELAFGAPVIESYGMTEVDQITCNPLPPAARKCGSVGLAGGPEVVIMGADGELLPPGVEGEVAVRGDNVMAGYEANQAANAAAFRHGFFHTGDLGVLDEDGYLFLRGRRKEVIDRGAEKVSPREVDEVLLDHPAVAQAATFPVAHPAYVQEVVAAVVPWPEMSVTPGDVRAFAARRLAPFKVPSRIVVVDEIPKGPTGKVQRDRLAEQLGVEPVTPSAGVDALPPRDPLEAAIATIWRSVLDVESVGVLDDFLQIGGSSLLAHRVLDELARTFGRAVPLNLIFETSTIATMATALRAEGWTASPARQAGA